MKPETRLVKAIQSKLTAAGFLAYKLHGGPMQMAGLPDLLCLVNGRAVWLEVKTAGGGTTKLQEHVMERLRGAGCRVAVVRSVEEAMAVVVGVLETA